MSMYCIETFSGQLNKGIVNMDAKINDDPLVVA
jgi:hypothetical protein